MNIKTEIFNTKDEFKKSGKIVNIWLSVSKAKTFDDCKAKFKFQYIKRLPRKEWDHLVFGKFLHAVLEYFHKKLIEEPEIKALWEDVLKEAWAEGVKKYKDTLTGEQKLEAGPIVREYRDLIRKEGLPNVTGIEKEFNILVDNGEFSILLNGFIDKVQIDEDGVLHVADYKTTKDVKYLKKDFFQLKVYAFVLMTIDPKLTKIRCSYIGLRHGFKYITQEFDRSVIDEIGPNVLAYASDIENEKMWRPNPSPLCQYCDFQDSCRAGERFLIRIGKKPQNKKVGQVSW